MDSPLPTNNSENLDLTGCSLGGYHLIRRIGEGGMASVYLAEQRSLNRQVAFKVLHAKYADDPKYVERFQREARAAARLNQTSIVQIYEVGKADDYFFIVQEYIRGQNLRQYIQRHGVLDPVLAVNVIRQVALALQSASEAGVIHRDIKPENIMLMPTGEVKITDFGLARVTHEESNELTQVGVTMGTPLYMSPEQVEGKPVDVRTDIYSLGITCYHVLVGRPPFEGDTPLAVAIQHVRSKPPLISLLRPDLPVELCQLVQKMMAKKPEQRFQSPSELLKALRKIHVEPHLDWSSLAETLRLQSEQVGLVQFDPLAETRKLAAMLQGTKSRSWKSMLTWAAGLLIITVGIGVGSGYALLTPPAPALPDPVQIMTNTIPKQGSIQEQYRWAYTIAAASNSEQAELAWRSVKEYFPPIETDSYSTDFTRKLWTNRANERLGELYLRTGAWEKARDVYIDLFGVEKNLGRFHYVGCAGLAVAYYHLNEHVLAGHMLFLVEPQFDILNDFMRYELELVLQDYESSIQN
ncbi:MAG TPA: protein kinase [Pirellulaceae bacterium]|nr:protein kinase [Pirellulaceae bacterium]HMO90954.1 protein kinase [Pirellulaceae bacterium]HMP69852.1 protein kinase [Pirellulaceae bacterium]